jgi:4-amino-4-deoxy-L-arabinose transferase-like glycosyltransferase
MRMIKGKNIKKYRWEILGGVFLFFLFLLTRLINLKIIPIFVDEAIYLRWAQIAKFDANWRFISLTDGKQPLFVWSTMVMMKLIKDPLVAGRLVSVISGGLTTVGLGLLSFRLFSRRRLAFFSVLLYVIGPFYLLYDRLALMDAMVATFSVYSLLLAVLLVQTLRLDVALILGAVLGGGILTKTSGFLNIYLLPLTLLLFDWRKKKWLVNFLKWLGLVLLAVIISQLFYSLLRLSPFFHLIAQKDTLFVYPLAEWLHHPWLFFLGNLRGLFDWLTSYLTWPVVVLVLASLFFLKQKPRTILLLGGWWLAPFVALALFGKVLYPRFILFMSLPLLILAAYSLEESAKKIKNKWLFLLFCLLIFNYSLYFDAALLFQPQMAPLPKSDKGQYLDDWPAGYGVNEVVAFAQKEAEKQAIFIATEGTFGLMPYSLELYLWDNPRITIKGYWPVKTIPEEVLASAREKPTYFVFNETQKIPSDWPLKLISRYYKGDGKTHMSLYQVVANEID